MFRPSLRWYVFSARCNAPQICFEQTWKESRFLFALLGLFPCGNEIPLTLFQLADWSSDLATEWKGEVDHKLRRNCGQVASSQRKCFWKNVVVPPKRLLSCLFCARFCVDKCRPTELQQTSLLFFSELNCRLELSFCSFFAGLFVRSWKLEVFQLDKRQTRYRACSGKLSNSVVDQQLRLSFWGSSIKMPRFRSYVQTCVKSKWKSSWKWNWALFFVITCCSCISFSFSFSLFFFFAFT